MALRVLFVNTGIMGHATVARLIREALRGHDEVEAEYLDLSRELSVGERMSRRLLTMGPGPTTAAGTLVASRYRHEMDAGVRAARRISALERSGRTFDVIHFHTQAAAWWSLPRMRRSPCVVSIDATQRLMRKDVDSSLVRGGYAAGAVRDARVFRAARAIISTSRWAAEDAARDLDQGAQNIHVMQYPVSLDGFDAAWGGERRARAADRPVHCLFIGGLFHEKGGDDLLAAWQRCAFGSCALLTIVTNDERVDEGRLPGGVSVVRGVRARTPEWLSLWRDADLFVMPTRSDPFGLVYQEAAAASLPVIATQLNAVPEIVAHGETGLLVPVGDTQSIATALQRLVGDADVRRGMGEAARRRVESHGSIERYGGELVTVLQGAMGLPRAHGSSFRRTSSLERVGTRIASMLPQGAARRELRAAFHAAMRLASGARGITAALPAGETVRLLPEFRYVAWNSAEYEAFRNSVKPGDVALDVGANAGAYALLLGMWVRPGGRVFAFEPAPDTFRGLSAHVRLNGLEGVVSPVPMAVAGVSGVASFTTNGTSGENHLLAGSGGTEVEAVTIDDFCRREKLRPAFIKIDVEGYELDVLRGARETIRAAGESLALFVEMHPAAWRTMGITRHDVEAELALQGLRAEALTKAPDPWALEGECLRLTRVGSGASVT